MIKIKKIKKSIFLLQIINKVFTYFEYIKNYSRVNIVASRLKFCGTDVIIDYNVWFNNTNKISIGNGCFIGRDVYVNAYGDISIGNDCSIAAGCKLISGNRSFEKNGIPISVQEVSIGKIVLQDDVWLGYDVIVLPGVTLKEGCVVAANSVVTKSFEAFSIIAGAPAKSVGRRT